MRSLPIFINLAGKQVAVIGGGTAAARKCDSALRAGATVTAYAEALGSDFHDVLRQTQFRHVARKPKASDLEGAAIVFCATGSEADDVAAHKFAKKSGALVNVTDRPELCDFTMPSILDRDPLVVAIGTEGTSPILGRMLKARLETEIPAAYGRLAEFAGRQRDAIAGVLPSGVDRRRFWERVLEGPIAELVLAGQETRAERKFAEALAEARQGREPNAGGEVYLVGAGPGDPDLVTFRAYRLMQRADVVLYDRLVSDEIVDLVRRDAERIYVGKQRNRHPVPQEEISAILVREAKAGRRVLRLKGGDPFIFGRGGEEIEVLAEHGIPFQVVPGITAAAGCAAYAGIPLTHRDHAQSCVFVAGHGKDGSFDLDWKALIQPQQTVAVYMGLGQIGDLLSRFVEHGASPDLPAAVIDNGTKANQRVVTGTLSNLAQRAAEAGLRGPTIILIGTVVTLHGKLEWFGEGDNRGAAGVPTPAAAAKRGGK
jgi:uroporphyrin-III C-methyltransferase/precorrin-2 dehydrogenase/sirohydrochlorin ferrochelatase